VLALDLGDGGGVGGHRPAGDQADLRKAGTHLQCLLKLTEDQPW
jgi:hypothetical protein